MIHKAVEHGTAKEFKPDDFFRQIQEQEGTGVAYEATHSLIIMLTCLKTDKTYKEYMDEWTMKR